MDFSSDLRSLVSFSDDQTAGVWDIAANERVATFSGHSVSMDFFIGPTT